MLSLRHSLLLLPLLVLPACATNPVTGGSNLALMSEEQELAIGRQTHAKILEAYGEYDNPELQSYVERIGDRLAANGHRPELIYRFTVLDSKEVNAFALPGGYIYITRGLLAYLNSEAELAAVLGHEIGHVTARHAVQQYSAAQMANFGALLGAIFVPGLGTQAGQALAQVGGTAILRGYGREHELEADRLGAEYIARTGYDPREILAVLRVLKDQERYATEIARQEGREPSSYHGLFATHPDNDTRLQEVVATATSLQTVQAPTVGRERFLELIDGLVYGDSARQGIVRGHTLYHGDLGFALKFPRDWRIDNQPSQVAATAPDGNAQQILVAEDLNKRIPPRQYLLERLKAGEILEQGELEINGLPAYTLRTVVNSRNGRQTARFTTVYFHDKAYTLAGISRASGQTDGHDLAFLESARSFHELTENERLLAKPLHLSIIEAESDTSYSALAAQSALESFAEQQLRLLNGAYPDGTITAGQHLKIVQ